ncbi:hypothetical protein A8990_16322 [Paenibacillus taihuensis]|uniref:Uncharacterized protein n=1 Tax=Paenibacillus taihuensis TaxID=1156355 RepID=A0A3D9Q1R0_9BACL|nr:hypothetical protein A8990_16322 [Paenibacillus taihuensis]
MQADMKQQEEDPGKGPLLFCIYTWKEVDYTMI